MVIVFVYTTRIWLWELCNEKVTQEGPNPTPTHESVGDRDGWNRYGLVPVITGHESDELERVWDSFRFDLLPHNPLN